MRLLLRLLVVSGLLAGLLAAQSRTIPLPPVPPNPNDPVTGSALQLTTPAQRAAALNLLTAAAQNYSFDQQGGPALAIELSLQSSGNLRFEGNGTMTEVWSGGRRTWWASFDNENSGLLYRLRSHPVPLRVAQARRAVLSPLTPIPARAQVRAARGVIQSTPVTCLLVNHAAQVPHTSGRDRREAEYCLDAAGRLLLASPAPGLFYEYDYSQPAVQYAGHTLASSIRLVEGARTVMQIQISRLGPPNSEDLSTLQHAPHRQGILAYGTAGWYRTSRRHPVTEVCVLQFSVGPGGRILESEVIPNEDPGFEERALEQIQNYFSRPLRGERVYLLREAQ